MPEHLRDGLARRAAVEELHGAAAAEAVGAQPCDVDPHSGEGVRREGEEDVAVDALTEVRLAVQTGVLPLAVDGQAVDRQAGRIEGTGQSLDIGGPRGELACPMADLPHRQARPEPGGELGEGRRVEGPEACEAEPHALEECERARTGVRRLGEDRGLAREPGICLRAEDGQVDEVGEDDRVAHLPLHDIVVAQGRPLEQGGGADRLFPGPLPNRQGGGGLAGRQPARPAALPGREGGERVGRWQLEAEERPSPAPQPAEGAADARAHVLDRGVLDGGRDAGQVGERVDGARPLLRLGGAQRASRGLRQKVGEVGRVRRQEGRAGPARVLLPPC